MSPLYSRQRSTSPTIRRSWPVSGANSLILGLASISTRAASSIFAGSSVLSEWPRYLSADWIETVESSREMRPACLSEANMSAQLVGSAVDQRLDHPGREHPLDVVVRREDYVVAGVALAQLGEQLVVAREQVVADVEAGNLPEVLKGRLADVGVPVIDADDPVALDAGEPGGQRRHGGGEGTPEKAAPRAERGAGRRGG